LTKFGQNFDGTRLIFAIFQLFIPKEGLFLVESKRGKKSLNWGIDGKIFGQLGKFGVEIVKNGVLLVKKPYYP